MAEGGRSARHAVERGRRLYGERAWADAYEALSGADRSGLLAADDLERLATVAYLLGRDAEQLSALERAHRAHVERGDRRGAVRCAFWLGVHLLLRREPRRATGWFGRARRLLEREPEDGAERGYLLLVADLECAVAGDWEGAVVAAAAAADVAERFRDQDVLALALMDQGRALVRLGRTDEGLVKLDQAMFEATARELSPVVTGLVYCSVIDGCHEVHELSRAGEWTVAMSEWCDRQAGLVPFTGVCQVHRAELLQLRGDWAAALDESRLARERFALRADDAWNGQAAYRHGELLRLRGELVEAEAAYRDASRLGVEPQPGLALLRLAQGRTDAAATTIARSLAGTTEWIERVRLLPAQVEIALRRGDLPAAQAACAQLEEIAGRHDAAMLRAQAGTARGAVQLAADDARGALRTLRKAQAVWQELAAPYEVAQTRVLVARACLSLGDDESAALELDAARILFEQLGAAPDVGRVGALTGANAPGDSHGLTERELQVLRLVAAGGSNKVIAAELVVSKRTVDRHVSNIFTKLEVSSRAAATAYAYRHRLI